LKAVFRQQFSSR